MNLQHVKPGTLVRITRIEGNPAIRQRLFDMGLMPNVRLVFERVAPLGYPVWVKLQGTQLSLRKNEAASVEIEPVCQ